VDRFMRRFASLTSLGLGPLLQRSDAMSGPSALRVRNGGSHAVQSLFVAPAGSREPGVDRLAEPLEPSKVAEIVLFANACAFDLRAVYADGHEELVTGLGNGTQDVTLRY
jgi:hypothetical protein